MTYTARLAALMLAVALAACGGGGSAPPPSVGQATIDAAGGTVDGPDGVRLVVPAAALASTTTLRFARDGSGAPELGGAKAISPVYSVTPHGTAARFDRPYGLAFDTAGNLIVLQLGASSAAPAWVRRITPSGVVTTLFDARTEAAALAADGNAVANARTVKGIAAPGSNRIALSAGNAVLVRTLP